MELQPTIYLDNNIFIDILDPTNSGLKATFRRKSHRIVFSDIHLSEGIARPDLYASLLTELDAVFLSNYCSADGKLNRMCCFEPANAEDRFTDCAEQIRIFQAYEALLRPLSHLMGARKTESWPNIVNEMGGTLTATLDYLLDYESGARFSEVGSIHKEIINASSEKLRHLDFSSEIEACTTARKRARDGDKMRDMSSIEKVEFLMSHLGAAEQDDLRTKFPRHFAQKQELGCGDVAGFA